ncbi:MAG: hypothetical protein ACETWG_07955 [Candidatus Neomarinimicrobiota bacterium]
MDFFKSPLFWIIVIWWLLSTFLGARARRRRAMQARSAPPGKPVTPAEKPAPKVGREVTFQRERPPEARVEVEALEKRRPPRPVSPRLSAREGRPEPPPKPAMPLEDVLRKLGLAEELIPGVLRPETEEPALEEEPEILAEPEPVEAPPEPPPVKPIPTRRAEYVAPRVEPSYPLLPEAILGRLSPLQQVILLREVLGAPRALRGSIR